MTLQEINQKIREIEAQIEPLRKFLSELRKKRMAAASKFKVGDVVKWGKNRGKVLRFSESFDEQPDLWVSRIRKDGSTGSECQVYKWSNPTLDNENPAP